MTRRAAFRESDVTRLVRGAIKGGLPVGSFKVVVEDGNPVLLPISANDPANAEDDDARRMREAFGE